MTLVFITGISGAGKSTVREELKRRGLRALDTDEDEIAQWQHKVTGEITPLVADEHRTPEFIDQNVWRAEPARVRRLAENAGVGTIFLCGSVGNDDEVWPYFDKAFLLTIDEATMRHRLATRTSHDFGTKPHELELLLAWNEVIHEHYFRYGAIVVDASRPVAVVVDEILGHLRA